MLDTAGTGDLPCLFTLFELQISSGTSAIFLLGLVISIFPLALVFWITRFFSILRSFLFLFNNRFGPLELFETSPCDRYVIYEEAHLANFVIINTVMSIRAQTISVVTFVSIFGEEFPFVYNREIPWDEAILGVVRIRVCIIYCQSNISPMFSTGCKNSGNKSCFSGWSKCAIISIRGILDLIFCDFSKILEASSCAFKVLLFFVSVPLPPFCPVIRHLLHAEGVSHIDFARWCTLLHRYVSWDLIPRTRLDTESQLGKLSSVLCFPGLCSKQKFELIG